MGFRLEPDKVREIAMEMMQDVNPWDYGGPDDVGYFKAAMYNMGILELASEIVKAIEELKNA